MSNLALVLRVSADVQDGRHSRFAFFFFFFKFAPLIKRHDLKEQNYHTIGNKIVTVHKLFWESGELITALGGIVRNSWFTVTDHSYSAKVQRNELSIAVTEFGPFLNYPAPQKHYIPKQSGGLNCWQLYNFHVIHCGSRMTLECRNYVCNWCGWPLHSKFQRGNNFGVVANSLCNKVPAIT